MIYNGIKRDFVTKFRTVLIVVSYNVAYVEVDQFPRVNTPARACPWRIIDISDFGGLLGGFARSAMDC